MPSVLGRDRRQFQRGNDLSVLRKQEIGRKWSELALSKRRNCKRRMEWRTGKNLLSNDSTEKGYQKDARILRVRGREMKLGD